MSTVYKCNRDLIALMLRKFFRIFPIIRIGKLFEKVTSIYNNPSADLGLKFPVGYLADIFRKKVSDRDFAGKSTKYRIDRNSTFLSSLVARASERTQRCAVRNARRQSPLLFTSPRGIASSNAIAAAAATAADARRITLRSAVLAVYYLRCR